MTSPDTNQTIMNARWPGLLEQLSASPAPLDIQEITEKPEWTLRVNGRQLTSAYNRCAEARLQADLVPAGATCVWVYGVALGDLPRVLLERAEIEALHVGILSPSLAAYSFQHSEHGDWLGDPRVHLHLLSEADVVQRPFAVAPACLPLSSPELSRLRDELVLALSEPFRAAYYEGLESQLLARFDQNRAFIEHDLDVATLFETRTAAQAVVVGGGPSLDAQLEWLKSRRHRLLTIASTTALKPLEKAGIEPDLVVVVDHREGMAEHLSGVDVGRLKSVPLVYVPEVHSELLHAWPGPRYCAYLRRPRYAALQAKLPRGSLFCAGTVMHACVDLAVRMGAADVVLMGLDLAYPQQVSHAQHAHFRGAVDPATVSLFVPNGRGEPVATNTSYVGYLRDLERYIAHIAHVRFINAGEEGAFIAGTLSLHALDEGMVQYA